MKFILDHFMWVSLAVASGLGLLWTSFAGRGKVASPLEVTLLINRGKTVIVDVREAAEFAAGHLRDAKNIPLKELADRVGELGAAKGRTVVVVCQSGSRSASALGVLAKAGFEDAVGLEGGVAAWQAQNLPLSK